MEEIKIDLFGRVQGVGFRHFVKENADKLNLKGLVMNNSDGSVSIIAQGKKEDLDVFLQNVQKGPLLSKVDGVSYYWRDKSGEYGSFVIALDKGLIEDQKSSFLNLGKKLLNIKNTVPVHIAIIPDGNRRWAKEKGIKSILGHKKSASNLISLLEEARKSGVKYVTFWAFSTENWKREKSEVDYLFSLLSGLTKKFKQYAVKNKIRFRHLGRTDRLPKEFAKNIEESQKETENFEDFNVQICLDYGGRDEIVRAVNKILRSGVQEVKEEDMVNYLDSAGIPDPDLIIRTSGEKRTSGFMPFQASYSEFYFTDVHFPDFKPEDLRKAIEEFSRRRRNFGR